MSRRAGLRWATLMESSLEPAKIGITETLNTHLKFACRLHCNHELANDKLSIVLEASQPPC